LIRRIPSGFKNRVDGMNPLTAIPPGHYLLKINRTSTRLKIAREIAKLTFLTIAITPAIVIRIEQKN
jgi:hypothetical protein